MYVVEMLHGRMLLPVSASVWGARYVLQDTLYYSVAGPGIGTHWSRIWTRALDGGRVKYRTFPTHFYIYTEILFVIFEIVAITYFENLEILLAEVQTIFGKSPYFVESGCYISSLSLHLW